MRLVSVGFNVYVTGKIGAGGIGLYSLIMSVGGFAITFATSGINYASTRMTAEALGKRNNGDIRRIMRRCIIYSLSFGFAGCLLLNIFAEPISDNLLCDIRCIMPLRLLSLALPFISLSSALSGYFNAVRRVYKNAVVQVGEQFITITVTVQLLALLLPRGIAFACTALIGGTVISEMLAFIVSYILYKIDLKQHIEISQGRERGLTKKMLSISLPIAFTAYVRSALVSVEHILIPMGLRKFGSSGDAAIASYGTLHGMVMPVVLFPMAIISAFAGLLVPEIAETLAAGDDKRVDNIVSRVFHVTLCFAIGCSGVMVCFSKELGILIYNSSEAGIFIRSMAPLIPVMYLDHVVDGILKGMGEQLYSMRVNIFDSFLSVILVYFMLPKWGIYGYVVIIFIMEIINASLSILKLLQRCDAKMKIIKWVIKPLICIVGSTSVVKLIISNNIFGFAGYKFGSAMGILLCLGIYCLLLVGTFSVTVHDIIWFRKAIK